MNMPDHIQNLISKYEQGQLSAAEKQELDNWYHSFDDQQTVVADCSQDSTGKLADRIGYRLRESMAREEATPAMMGLRGRRKWYKVASFALIIMLLSGTAYYFIKSETKAAQQSIVLNTPIPAGDVAPGGNKAMLTLDDGSVIILDSANNGILGEQGAVAVKKLDNGLIAYQNNTRALTEEKVFYNTISTPRGGEYKITLSDGTKVWLNAASSIRFPTAFRGADRPVQITGEVYFEVAHNEAKPFKVSAGKSAIEVLGTHFNVNAYDDEMQVRTSLLEGAVKVFAADETDRQQMKILKPGQQARMTRTGRIQVISDMDEEEVMAWKNGLFVFKSSDLRSIMRQIGRWYDVDIEYKGNVGMQFTGQITRNNNVSKVLDMLELTEEVKFRVEGKKVIVSR